MARWQQAVAPAREIWALRSVIKGKGWEVFRFTRTVVPVDKVNWQPVGSTWVEAGLVLQPSRPVGL